MKPPRNGEARYLLGELSQEEASALESGYFSDDELFERLCAMETDLLDEYVRGELTDTERAVFEERLSGSPSLRARLESAKALSRGLEWSEPRTRPAAPRKWALPAAAAAVLLLLAGIWLELERSRVLGEVRELRGRQAALEDENRHLSTELAAVKAKPSEQSGVPVASSPGAAVSFMLASGLWREVSAANDFRAPRDAGAVLLVVPVSGEAGWLYRVRIEDASGRLILEQQDLPPVPGKAGNVAVVATSPAGLPPGDYAVRLFRRRPASAYQDAGHLAFRITYR